MPQGKIVVASDEWTLTPEGFQRSPDAETFVKNIANWFTGGSKGKFHAYSSNGGLTRERLKKAMEDAGHEWTVNVNQKFDLETLKQYNGVFVGAEPKDNKVLIDYVKSGGNVYLMGGTTYGGYENEAKNWQTFLNEFGLEFAPWHNGVNDAARVINSNHPIFAGVKCLYYHVGHPILNIKPDAKDHQVFTSDPGLYAVFEKPETQQGKIVVASDEFTLSNGGFQRSPDAETFVKNVANWFTGGSKGKFHAYSNNLGLVEPRLKKAMEDAGHEWTVNVGQKFDLETLKQYNGVFVGGNALDNKVLIDYVKAGGNVYLLGGTGIGSPEDEAKRWKTFLNEFGLEFAPWYYSIFDAPRVINSTHPIFAGVKCLYFNNGQPILNIKPDAKDHQVFTSDPGLYAVFEKPETQQGKIVVASDEWTLTDLGFQRSPDAETFVKNVANWFTGGSKGKFHAYSSNGGLAQSRLAKAMKDAGHEWTVNVNQKFDLETLKQYNGVFVGAEPKDNKVLIDYVKSGGNVYLMGGTTYGGYENEAKNWQTFLNEFGLEFAPWHNGIHEAARVINSNHPIFAGVKCLYHHLGHPIVNIKPDAKDHQVFTSDPGLYAVFDGVFDAKEELPKDGNIPTTKELTVDTKLHEESEIVAKITNDSTKEVTYTFVPFGKWQPGSGIPECGSEGFEQIGDNLQQQLKYPNNTPFCLLAVNKKTGVVTEVKKETTIVVKPGETLQFLVNDFPIHYKDNTGTLTVKWSVK